MKWYNSAAAAALSIAVTSGVALAQGQQNVVPGSVLTVHTGARGACPALDWHIVVGQNNTLSAVIAWDDMKAVARGTGTVNMQARTFMLDVKEVGGQGRTAKIDGTVRQDGWFMAHITGPGVECRDVRLLLNAPQQFNG
jgi:hypothetical protein